MTTYNKEQHKYDLDSFPQSLERLERYLKANNQSLDKLVAVFDIGTKAGRLLIGKIDVPNGDGWSSYDFFNDGQVFNLGADIDLESDTISIERSQGLKGIIFFINSYLNIIKATSFNDNNIVIVGTAVFRWLSNSKDVIKHIKKKTGLELCVLSKEDESRFSSLAILHTLNYNKLIDNKIENIVLIDQGGGSTEISCFKPNLSNIGEGVFYSINDLGTVALQTDFYTASAKKRVKPWDNFNSISKQISRVKQIIDYKIMQWNGFDTTKFDITKENTLVYGLGSALTKCFGTGGSFKIHNRFITKESLDSKVDSLIKKYGASDQKVKTLYSTLNLFESKHQRNIKTPQKRISFFIWFTCI